MTILLVAALPLGAWSVPPAKDTPALLPDAPQSDARWAPIERFKKVAPPLAANYEARSHRSASGEVMPYKLFRPRVEPGRRYPLVVFLHGSGGSGTDNMKQLERADRSSLASRKDFSPARASTSVDIFSP
jgi:hypothetical protein